MNLPPVAWAIAAVMAVAPVAAIVLARRGQTGQAGSVHLVRFALLYALVLLLLAGAYAADGLPAAFGALGLLFALLGLGVGLPAVYRYLYGAAWLAAHPGVVEADIVRWQRVTLVVAVGCLLIALGLALLTSDVAHAPR